MGGGEGVRLHGVGSVCAEEVEARQGAWSFLEFSGRTGGDWGEGHRDQRSR